MSNIPKIGESEWYVMKALWENAPLSGNDIVKAVSAHRLVAEYDTDDGQRLVTKGVIRCDKQQVMMYSPLVQESDVVRRETDTFMQRVYEGSVNMLIKGYIESGELSKQEIKSLKKMLDEME